MSKPGDAPPKPPRTPEEVADRLWTTAMVEGKSSFLHHAKVGIAADRAAVRAETLDEAAKRLVDATNQAREIASANKDNSRLYEHYVSQSGGFEGAAHLVRSLARALAAEQAK